MSHDILNINQAVLSAIELMTESSKADEGAKRRARKVESQIRISTQIFESMKLLCVTRRAGGMPSDPVDLNDAVEKAVSESEEMFKDRSVSVEFTRSAGAPAVKGGAIVKELLLDSLMGLIQLDNSERPSIELRVEKGEGEVSPSWVVVFRDENVSVPASLALDSIGEMSDDSRTRMVRLAGLVLARVITEKLGGAFRIASSDEETVLEIVLLEADVS
ncbi:TPA: HAMP domain-containing histidine kinase [Thermoplasmata archaeon]|nr:HAMP domain-containing histidine kinase [Thermoplasmata archaeon]